MGLRNAEWAQAIREHGLDAAIPRDCVVRFEDSLAASRQLARHIATQCFAESVIAASAARRGAGGSERGRPP